MGIFEALTPEHYLDLLVSCLAHLSPDIVIHRVTGDGPKDSADRSEMESGQTKGTELTAPPYERTGHPSG